jgi:hypothetical protein
VMSALAAVANHMLVAAVVRILPQAVLRKAASTAATRVVLPVEHRPVPALKIPRPVTGTVAPAAARRLGLLVAQTAEAVANLPATVEPSPVRV